MKRKFVLIAALVAALAVVFIGCPYPTNGGGESASGGSGSTSGTGSGTGTGTGSESEGSEESGSPAPLVFNNPQFVGWGGLYQTTNTFEFLTSAGNNCRITYEFPEGASSYTNLTVEYTLTLKEGETKPMKVTIKNSLKDNWGGTSGDEYKQSNSDATMTYTALVSKFTTGAITFAHNTHEDGSSSFTITITKITFSND